MTIPPPKTGGLARLYTPLGVVVLAAVYLLVGLIGHDPWRGDDSRYLGPIMAMHGGGSWLLPEIAGEAAFDFPPLFYWTGALLARALHWWLPIADGARLASALWLGLLLAFLARAAWQFFGRETRQSAALLTLGTLGLVLHAHEIQPALALLGSVAITLSGLSELGRKPWAGAIEAGAGAGFAGLAAGLSGVLLSLPLLLLALLLPPGEDPRRERSACLLAVLLAVAIPAAWAGTLILTDPAQATLWWRLELKDFTNGAGNFGDLGRLAEQLGWFLWPLWPIAGWALWRARRELLSFRWRILLVALLLALVQITLVADSPRTANLLPLIPPLALIAAAGIPTLRRGAANAFDWFAVMTFLVFAILVWIAWSAMAVSWPPGLARQLVKLAPGFHLQFSLIPPLIGALLVSGWLLLVWNTPRTPKRGPINWAAGMTMLWCLAVTLLMPWFNHGKSYRPAAQSLAQQLAAHPGSCLAGWALSPSLRAWLF
jgi:4-amino-4-deoxy-L-arabinose transferase-like glycosyltransferase